MVEKRLFTSGKALFCASIFLFSLGCTQTQDDRDLGFVEVREYEGEKLSSVYDFRENSIKGPQQVNIETYRLSVTGLVESEKIFKYQDVIENYPSYRKVVRLNCVEGWSATILWEGIKISDLLEEVKIDSNADTIVFHAVDGYTTAFPLSYILDNDILLAFKMNNATIIPERGFPFQVVSESKWGYKWIKWVTKVELSNQSDYKGFWESRGYSDSGNLDESFLD